MDINSLEASKGNYKHFMLKEISEQPAIIKRICK
jgi:glucosamine 6-phosphate synthetase-like amidotransferase/phosphosugar isomerase protein